VPLFLLTAIAVLLLADAGWEMPARLRTAAMTAAAAQQDARLEFFSGYVVEVAEGAIVVTRSDLGNASEKREFKITAATKVEGKLRPKVRVTVGYLENDDGAQVAQQIIVRERDGQTPKKK
jgi:hypothetical protein